MLDLVSGFDRKEVTPIVMAYTGGQMIDTLRQQGIKCHVVQTRKAFDVNVFREIEEIIRTEGIDIIHAHGSRAASNLLWSAHRLRKPMIYTVHGWSFHQDQNPITYRLRAISEKIICRLSQRVICVSESNKQSGISTFGLCPSKCDVIENGVNLNRFTPNGTFRPIRKELGIRDSDYVVALIARITLQKAPIDFLKAIEKAHQRNGNIKGLLMGEGDMSEEVEQYIRSHRLEKSVFRSPFRTDIPDVLNAIDCYCLPSLWEGLSIALLEAMAMKKPVVVTPTDGTTEIIRDGHNGLIVPFRDSEQLAEAFTYMYDHADKAREMGERAHALVKERFDSQRVSNAVHNIYKAMLRP